MEAADRTGDSGLEACGWGAVLVTGDSEAAYPKIHSAANSNPTMVSWASSILFTAELISPLSPAAIAFISPSNSISKGGLVVISLDWVDAVHDGSQLLGMSQCEVRLKLVERQLRDDELARTVSAGRMQG